MKKNEIIVAVILVEVAVVLIIIGLSTSSTRKEKAIEQFNNVQREIATEAVETVTEEPTPDVIRYSDNNGYESEMTITEDGATFRDNNGYESNITVE